ncbi:tankyrase-2-like [Trichogramma pretiosum]|uniref:tankyrase-2-like n=1 Tax=Trichogramma pretiosum TaxID=7493 RepID=UPI0006C9A33C|nr:tankyrase-2-like [Trichogramma pretiosum]
MKCFEIFDKALYFTRRRFHGWVEHGQYIDALINCKESTIWEDENDRLRLLQAFADLGSVYKGAFSFRRIFRTEQIKRLILDSINKQFIYQGQIIIEFLARSGYKDEPEVDENGRPVTRRTTPIHRAAENNHHGLIHSLFKIYNRFDVNFTDESGYTHFHAACQSGCEYAVAKFLELGQDPNCLVPATGDSPLLLAARYDHTKVVEWLLRSGARPNLANEDNLTPLHAICRHGQYVDTAKRLLEISDEVNRPVEINARDKFGQTPLYLAGKNGFEEMFALLLRRGANPNLANELGQTPLHVIAEARETPDMMELLFQIRSEKRQPVRIDAQDESGKTALHYALELRRERSAEFLLKNGANPSLADKYGLTPLHIICDKPALAEKFFQIMTDQNQMVEVDARDSWGETPLHYALRSGHKKIIESLLMRGADPNLSSATGSTSLHIICERRMPSDDDMMKTFFEITDELGLSLNVDARDKWGWTPLQWAVERIFPHSVNVLLDRGADLASFVFPAESPFNKIFQSRLNFTSESELVGLLCIIDDLENKGYELAQSGALTIMKVFADFGSFATTEDLDKWYHDDERFAIKAKKIMKSL